jgi:hypothetical protein
MNLIISNTEKFNIPDGDGKPGSGSGKEETGGTGEV